MTYGAASFSERRKKKKNKREEEEVQADLGQLTCARAGHWIGLHVLSSLFFSTSTIPVRCNGTTKNESFCQKILNKLQNVWCNKLFFMGRYPSVILWTIFYRVLTPF
jgi:hypothetical protein